MKIDYHLHRYVSLGALAGLLALAALACGGPAAPSEPAAPVAPINIGGDLTRIDVCQAVPREDMEAALGRKLAGAPQPFDYFGAAGASGCTYDAGKDSSGAAYFGYVVFTPVATYDAQPLYHNADVSGLGQKAYFNNGADARQLWVKVNDRVAFVVAFGDQPNEAGARSLARLVLAAILSK
jgi:hypothetical protein